MFSSEKLIITLFLNKVVKKIKIFAHFFMGHNENKI